MADELTFAFVHGGGQGSWIWEDTIAALHRQSGVSQSHVLALDAPGCGAKRSRRNDDLTIEDVARDLIADLERAHARDVVLVGHSQGGQAMAFMIEQRPELFRRLIYLSCSIPLPGQSVLEMMGTGAHGSNPDEVGWPFDMAVHEVRERFSVMFCNDMDDEQAAAFLDRLNADMWPIKTYLHREWRYDHLGRVPATYVLCLQDQSLPAPWQKTFAARFQVDAIVQLDAGHQVMITRPSALAEVICREAVRIKTPEE